MGAHRTNPKALAASAGDLASIVRAETSFSWAYGFEVAIQPNPAKQAEITAFLDAELAAGKAPNEINTKFELKPEEQDLVVYHRIQQGRKIIITNQTAVANIRGPEHFRMPLSEALNRAQQAFDGGPSENKA